MGVENGLTWAAVLTWFVQRTSWPEQPPNAAEATEALEVGCELTQFVGVWTLTAICSSFFFLGIACGRQCTRIRQAEPTRAVRRRLSRCDNEKTLETPVWDQEVDGS